MYKTVTKLILVFFCLSPLAAAEKFTYHIDISNHHPVVKEAVILTMEFNQTRAGKVIRFSFTLPKDKRYDTEFLEANENKDFKNRTHVIMKYAIFPKKAIKLNIPLKVTLQEASREELKKFVTGSADELMYLQTINKVYKLPAIELQVKPLPHETKIVGDYHLTFAIDHNQTTADKQINIAYTLSGRGYRPDIQSLLPPIDGVTAFLAKEQFHDKLFHKIVFHYALISNQNFTIPQIKIPAYSPKSNKRYLLSTEPVRILVHPAIIQQSKTRSLFFRFKWSSLKQYFDYFLIFLAGFLSYYIIRLTANRHKKSLSAEQLLLMRIKNARTDKEILQILIASKKPYLEEEIISLEKQIYEKTKTPLAKLKKRVSRKILHKPEFFDI